MKAQTYAIKLDDTTFRMKVNETEAHLVLSLAMSGPPIVKESPRSATFESWLRDVLQDFSHIDKPQKLIYENSGKSEIVTGEESIE